MLKSRGLAFGKGSERRQGQAETHENSLKLGSVLVASDGMGYPSEARVLCHRAKHIHLSWWSETLKEGPEEVQQAWTSCPQANSPAQPMCV